MLRSMCVESFYAQLNEIIKQNKSKENQPEKDWMKTNTKTKTKQKIEKNEKNASFYSRNLLRPWAKSE